MMYGITDNFEQIWSRNPDVIYKNGMKGCPSFDQFLFSNKPVLFGSRLELELYGIDIDEFFSTYKDKIIEFEFKHNGYSNKDNLVAWKDGAEYRAKRIVELYTTTTDHQRHDREFHREVGYMLGYPIDEINTFIDHGVETGCYY